MEKKQNSKPLFIIQYSLFIIHYFFPPLLIPLSSFHFPFSNFNFQFKKVFVLVICQHKHFFDRRIIAGDKNILT